MSLPINNSVHNNNNNSINVENQKAKPLHDSDTVEKNDSPFIARYVIKNRFSPMQRQIFAALSPILTTIISGMVSGYSAVLLPQLALPLSTIRITAEQGSWVASMAPLLMSAGCIIGGILMEPFGRRIPLMFANILFVIGWVIISLSGNISWLIFGRLVTGFASGLYGPTLSVYIGETSEPKYRGFLLAGNLVGLAFGVLVVHLLGMFLNWKLTALVCATCGIICYALSLLAPETPSWYLLKGRLSEAEDSYRWLRGYSPAATAEFIAMTRKHEEETNRNAAIENLETTWQQLKINIIKKNFIKPLLIIMFFFLVMQFCGINVVIFYSVTLIKHITTDINEYVATVIMDTIRVLAAVVGCFLLRVIGRRRLALISSIGTTVSLVFLTIFLYTARMSGAYQNQSTVPMILLVVMICFMTIGISPLPWVMMGELFPLKMRGIGSGIASAFNFLIFFVVIKVLPSFLSSLHIDGTFLIYTIVSIVGTIFILCFLPETKNKTLQQIEDELNKKVEKSVKPLNRNESVTLRTSLRQSMKS